MAEVILFNISTKHQHVCSTFARHTKPTAQNQTLQKSSKRSNSQQPNSGNIFQHIAKHQQNNNIQHHAHPPP
jgi:hypothetical protein